MEKLILVDEKDNVIGFEEKVKAHLGDGKLHRAFSIFVFNSKNQLLIQKRAKEKMLFGGLWANTCCSHPRKGEKLEVAIHRRLKEELGFDCKLKKLFSFIYHAKFKDIGSEYEFDHFFLGKYDGKVKPNPEEVAARKWIDVGELKKDIQENSDRYCPWFKTAFPKVLKFI